LFEFQGFVLKDSFSRTRFQGISLFQGFPFEIDVSGWPPWGSAARSGPGRRALAPGAGGRNTAAGLGTDRLAGALVARAPSIRLASNRTFWAAVPKLQRRSGRRDARGATTEAATPRRNRPRSLLPGSKRRVFSFSVFVGWAPSAVRTPLFAAVVVLRARTRERPVWPAQGGARPAPAAFTPAHLVRRWKSPDEYRILRTIGW
jgi:hypothetical protein